MASAVTISSLHRLSAPTLSALLLEQDPTLDLKADTSRIAIIDVRDDDYIGGHIKGAHHFPSRTLDATLPALVRKLQDKETVVFHCALSQQRGPGAALRYLRERQRILGTLNANKKKNDTEQQGSEEAKEEDQAAPVEQKVYVLDRGFVGWQEVYGEDERLTEGYRKELWKDGYWM
ncbi:Rhodanese-like domain-containing protein [Podospora australis]|uniref:Rhodanese-like domain-containing protein n=1 Tax=Podospora australis TaxID=1536484 RepID=A0AAN6WK84_9PEZI|nr:Rhodanese-like domain-containing protein [Podospora australis]